MAAPHTRAIWLCHGLLSAMVCCAEGTPPPHLTVLQYHHISAQTPAATSTSPDRFRDHMDWLAANDYRVVALPDALAALRAGEQLPDRSVAITFDDGYRSIYTTAFPILRKRGWPFTIFVNPEPHDQGQPGWSSWNELREMGRSGATLANHTVRHTFLLRREPDESDAAWRARVKQEIQGAEQRIELETGQTHKLLAYPYGESNLAIRQLATELNYVAFGQQSGPVGTNSDYSDLPRFPLGGIYSDMESFPTKMRSLPMPVTRIEVSARSGDGTLRHAEERPTLTLSLAESRPVQLNCFASGQGAAAVEYLGGGAYRVKARSPLPVGRSRYNCTYLSPWDGRYYWYSQAWIRRGADGTWAHE